VTEVVDTVPDNIPGEMNEDAPAGNHVVVDHGNGEHSVLAHLRLGSVTVEEGDRVETGQRLGACGNSGRSSEPHLPYHLQTGSVFGEGIGLPAPFDDYVADGEPVERGEPIRDQVIRSVP
jgi:murein DD-endopeptidase MepM/ murein hydrolase activator NlpD